MIVVVVERNISEVEVERTLCVDNLTISTRSLVEVLNNAVEGVLDRSHVQGVMDGTRGVSVLDSIREQSTIGGIWGGGVVGGTREGGIVNRIWHRFLLHDGLGRLLEPMLSGYSKTLEGCLTTLAG